MLPEKVKLLENNVASVPWLGIKGYEWWLEVLHGVSNVNSTNPDSAIEGDVGDVLDVRGPSDFHVMDGGDAFLILPLDAASRDHGFPQSREDEIDNRELLLLLPQLLLFVLLRRGRFRALAGAAAAPRHHHHPSHGCTYLLTPLSLECLDWVLWALVSLSRERNGGEFEARRDEMGGDFLFLLKLLHSRKEEEEVGFFEV